MTPSDVRRVRRRLGLSQAGFARLVGVASNSVARWERGERTIQPTTARLIQFVVAEEADRRRAVTRRRP